MDGRTLIFFASPGTEDPLRRRLDPVIAEWPSVLRPEVLTTTEIATLPERADGGVAFLIFGPQDTLDSARGAFTRLADRNIPAVIVTPHFVAWRSHFHGQGIIVAPAETTPPVLAAMLYALLERQPMVRAMGRDIRIAQAAQGAQCGEMARLHDELNLAANVQRQFIPRKLPKPGGLEFAALFRPAGYVSGDVFGVRQIDDNRWAFFIADVVGHGVPAALLTMVVARALASFEKSGEGGVLLKPADALVSLNRELCEQPDGPQRFATAVYGVIDSASRRVVLCSAGHPPPLVVDRGGVKATLDDSGPLLGVFDDAEFPQQEVELQRGQALLLYTDGFELAFPAADTGPHSLKPNQNYVRHLAHIPHDREIAGGLPAALRRLEDALDAQIGSLHRPDDVTALAIAPALDAASAALAA